MDNVTDADSEAVLGIAVTAVDTANGAWFYSTDGGTNWNALGAVATNNARLLAADANTRIYFQPNADYSGTLASAMTLRAWDRTSGTNGNLADTTTNGGSTAFSSATDTASLVVFVNDVPTGITTSGPLSVQETVTSGGTIGAAYDPGTVQPVVATLAGTDVDIGDSFTYARSAARRICSRSSPATRSG